MDQWPKYQELKPLNSQEEKRVNLYDLGFGSGFLDIAWKEWTTKETLINWTLSKLRTFVHQKTLTRQWKDSL